MIPIIDFNEVIRSVSEEVFDKIVTRTPRDTGRAQDGWEFSFDDSSSRATISNEVPYIGILENGWSDQAPNGFVRITLEEIPDIVAAAIDVQFQQK